MASFMVPIVEILTDVIPVMFMELFSVMDSRLSFVRKILFVSHASYARLTLFFRLARRRVYAVNEVVV